jgi:hypothetical protein
MMAYHEIELNLIDMPRSTREMDRYMLQLTRKMPARSGDVNVEAGPNGVEVLSIYI